MRIDVSVSNGAKDVLVLVAPKVFLLDDDVHEVFLGEERGLAAAVAVEDAEKGAFEIFAVGGALVRNPKHVLHVPTATLVAVAGHSQIHPDAQRHRARLVRSLAHPIVCNRRGRFFPPFYSFFT